MKSTKILFLTGNLSASISGGMGIAASEIAKNLSVLSPLILITSEENNSNGINDIQQLYKVTSSSPAAEKYAPFSVYPSCEISTSTYNFLISPYYSEIIKEETTLETTLGLDATPSIATPKQLSYLEEVSLFNQKIVELAITMTYDVIYCHDWITFQAGITLKLKTGKKLVLHVHSLEVDRNKDFPNQTIFNLERKAMDYANLVFTVSNYSKAIIQERYEIYAEKIQVVYNAYSEEYILKKKDTSKSPSLLFLGRLEKQKGADLYLKIAEKVVEKYPTLKVLIAGSGELGEELKEALTTSPIRDSVFLLGQLTNDQKYELLSETTVFCMPSTSEPFGLSALEAASAGVACVLSTKSGISELLESALLNTPEDVDGFAVSILAILEDPLLRASIEQNQLEQIKKLTWKNVAKQIFDLV